MAHYRDLRVWQLCRVLTKDIYTLTSEFPNTELYGLTSQMRRAAMSVMCNIAEGQGRWSARDQCNFYSIARGSLLETETQLFIAADLGFIAQHSLQTHLARCEDIGRKLNSLIESTRKRNRGPRTEDRGQKAEA